MTESEATAAKDGSAVPTPEPIHSCATLRQGDVVNIQEINIISGGAKTFKTPYGASIVSQACDIVLENRPNISVAAIKFLTGDEAKKARDGAQSRYVELPFYHADAFIDLEYISTIDKSHLKKFRAAQGVDPKDTNEVRRVGLALGRRFSRFAFPDEVNPWLRPLSSEIRKKYDRVTSPLGRALQEIVEVRIESPDWTSRPLDLVVHMIMKAGSVPEFNLDDDDDGSSEVRPELVNFLNLGGEIEKTPAQVANYLYSIEPGQPDSFNSFELYNIWHGLSQAFARLCKPSDRDAKDPKINEAVKSVEAQLWSDDEFPLSRCRRSEILDVDDLSGRVPLADLENRPTPDTNATTAHPSHSEARNDPQERGYLRFLLPGRLLRRIGRRRGTFE
ncbi:hypothetical protein OHS18_27200 [Amycolatopsis sp. NBC_00355]